MKSNKSEVQKTEEKKPYAKPELRSYGDAKTLIQQGPGSGLPDEFSAPTS